MIFGESDRDRRDFLVGLAGFSAGLHALRILAEKGLASSYDIAQAQIGIRAVLDQMPEGQIAPELLDQLDALVTNLGVAAAQAERRRDEPKVAAAGPFTRPIRPEPEEPKPVLKPGDAGYVYKRAELDEHGRYAGPDAG